MTETTAHAAHTRRPGPPRAMIIASAILGAALLAGCPSDPSPSGPIAGIVVDKASIATAEGGSPVAFAVVLGTAPQVPVDVDLSLTDWSEGLIRRPAGASSQTLTLTFTSVNWNVPQTVEVVPQQDSSSDGNQTYTITLSPWTSDPVYSMVPEQTISVTNADDDLPAVTVSKTTASTSEAATTDTFTVRLNTQPTATVTIPVTATDTTEGLLRGGNYPSTSVPTVTLTFTTANYSTPQTVTIYGQGDLIDDGNQTYPVTVGPPTGAPEYATLAQQTVSVTNLDDDAAGITVAANANPLVTSENGTTATFTVRLNTEPTAAVTVNVTSGNLAEGLLSAGVENLVDVAHLVFTPLNWATPQQVTVTGQDEVATQVPSDNVAYDVTVGPAAGDAAYAALATQAVHMLNTDNDTPTVIVPAVATGLQTSETGAANTTTFTVVLNKLPATNVVVPVTVGDVSEGLVKGGSSPSVAVSTLNLTFTPADFSTPQTVTLIGQVDNAVDGNQTYAVTVGTPTGDALYTSIAPQTITVTNSDSDTAGFTKSSSSLSLNEGSTTTFTVVLNRAPVADVVIPVTSSDPTEGKVAGGDSGGAYVATLNLTFTQATWQTPQSVTVQAQTDSIDDNNQTYTITVGPTSSTSAPYSGVAAQTISATTQDVDTAGFTVTPLSGLVVSETGTTATFTVRLDTIPLGTVSVPVSVSDSSEALVSTSLAPTPTNFLTLTFTASDWSTPQTVTVTGVGDVEVDGTKPWTVSVGPTTSGDTKYSGLAAKSVTGSTRDDDATAQGSVVTPIDITGLLPYASQVGSGSSYYMVTGLAAGTSTLRLTGVAGDVSLAVYGNSNFSSQLLCQSAIAGDTAGESCGFTVPVSGIVYVLVSAAGGTTGALYTIDQGPPPPTPETEPNGTIATADGPYSADVTLTGAIASTEYDYFAVSNTGGVAASVVMETFTGSVGACSYDTVLDLYNAVGTSLARDDDGGLGACSLLTYSIPAGTTVYVRVTSWSGSSIPGYLLVLNFP